MAPGNKRQCTSSPGPSSPSGSNETLASTVASGSKRRRVENEGDVEIEKVSVALIEEAVDGVSPPSSPHKRARLDTFADVPSRMPSKGDPSGVPTDDFSSNISPAILTLPTELFAEILMHTQSLRTVLAVSRTCRSFRTTLLKPASDFIWKAARMSNQNPIDLPDGTTFFDSSLPRSLPDWTAEKWQYGGEGERRFLFSSESAFAAFVYDGYLICEVCLGDHFVTPRRLIIVLGLREANESPICFLFFENSALQGCECHSFHLTP